MTERSLGRSLPGDRNQGGYAASEHYYGAAAAVPGRDSPAAFSSAASGRGRGRRAADSKGFLEALFDFSFTTFATTKITKALYILILIMTGLAAFTYTILAFSASPVFGFLTLIIGDPLFIIIVMAFWRLILESFVVAFRIAEDLHALRERGDQ
jgi:hypothetical protein